MVRDNVTPCCRLGGFSVCGDADDTNSDNIVVELDSLTLLSKSENETSLHEPEPRESREKLQQQKGGAIKDGRRLVGSTRFVVEPTGTPVQKYLGGGWYVITTMDRVILGDGSPFSTVDMSLYQNRKDLAYSQSLVIVEGRLPHFDFDSCFRPHKKFSMRVCAAPGTVSGEVILALLRSPTVMVMATTINVRDKPKDGMFVLLSDPTLKTFYTYQVWLQIEVDPSVGRYAVRMYKGQGIISYTSRLVIPYKFQPATIAHVD